MLRRDDAGAAFLTGETVTDLRAAMDDLRRFVLTGVDSAEEGGSSASNEGSSSASESSSSSSSDSEFSNESS